VAAKVTRLLLRLLRPLWRIRRLALSTEVLFWWKWLREPRSSKLRAELLDPAQPLAPEIVDVVDRLGGARVRILEVGAGPLTTIGQRHPAREVAIEIVSTDVLAPTYARLLRRRGMTPVVPTVYADAERLTETFALGSFDVVFAGNCVDHMERPILAIEQMLEVVRAGGSVLLVHFIDEGKKQDYAGLHAWNLREENGTLIVANDRERIDVGEHFAGRAEVLARVRGELVIAELRKR